MGPRDKAGLLLGSYPVSKNKDQTACPSRVSQERDLSAEATSPARTSVTHEALSLGCSVLSTHSVSLCFLSKECAAAEALQSLGPARSPLPFSLGPSQWLTQSRPLWCPWRRSLTWHSPTAMVAFHVPACSASLPPASVSRLSFRDPPSALVWTLPPFPLPPHLPLRFVFSNFFYVDHF